MKKKKNYLNISATSFEILYYTYVYEKSVNALNIPNYFTEGTSQYFIIFFVIYLLL